MKKELQVMLKTPFDHQVYGGAYPTMGGGMPVDVMVKKEEKAVEVLKNNLLKSVRWVHAGLAAPPFSSFNKTFSC